MITLGSILRTYETTLNISEYSPERPPKPTKSILFFKLKSESVTTSDDDVISFAQSLFHLYPDTPNVQELSAFSGTILPIDFTIPLEVAYWLNSRVVCLLLLCVADLKLNQPPLLSTYP